MSARERRLPVHFTRDHGVGRRVPLAGLAAIFAWQKAGVAVGIASFFGALLVLTLLTPVEVFRLRPARKLVLRWLQTAGIVPLTSRAAWARFEDVAELAVEPLGEDEGRVHTYRVWLTLESGERQILEDCPAGRLADLAPRVHAAGRLLEQVPLLPASFPEAEEASA